MPVANLEAQLAYYHRQAAWTAGLRAHLYRQTAVGTRARALDVGCGDGWLTAELAGKVRGEAVGCDLDEAALAAARAAHPGLRFVQSEPAKLPFADGAFDFVGCHFTLLWAADPVALLREMKRVAAPGGAIVLFAEPDWGGFVEWPDFGLRELLCAALAVQGADPLAGRKLTDWAAQAGLALTVGLTGGPWQPAPGDIDALWEHPHRLLDGFANERRLRVTEGKERQAWADGRRSIHLPLGWGWGNNQ
jgi:ubiquinone/menaquinone biosynthesis C-methylase UbiE